MEENEKEAFLHDWVVEEIQKNTLRNSMKLRLIP